jgi:hypothetical protein
MYENGKMRPVETIWGIGGEGIKENDGGGEFNYDVRIFVNVTMYPQHNNNMIIKMLKNVQIEQWNKRV